LLLYFLIGINQKEQTKIEKTSKGIFKYIAKDKIIKLYLIFYFIGTVAMNTGIYLKMLMFTNIIGFSDSGATKYFLVIGLAADIIGVLALKYFTPKNDYITITIKFGIRFFAYVLVFLSNNIFITIIAISWSMLISTAYENKTDAPYINSIPNEYQLLFGNIRYIVGITAEATGIFFAGVMYEFGIRYMLGLSALLLIFQIGMAYRLIYMRTHKGIDEKTA